MDHIIQQYCEQEQPHGQHTWVWYGPSGIGFYANCAGYNGHSEPEIKPQEEFLVEACHNGPIFVRPYEGGGGFSLGWSTCDKKYCRHVSRSKYRVTLDTEEKTVIIKYLGGVSYG